MPQIGFNLAQLVSPSVAFPVELVSWKNHLWNLTTLSTSPPPTDHMDFVRCPQPSMNISSNFYVWCPPLLAPCSYLCYAVSPPKMFPHQQSMCSAPHPSIHFSVRCPPPNVVCAFSTITILLDHFYYKKNLQFYKLVSYNDQVTVIRNYKLAHKDSSYKLKFST